MTDERNDGELVVVDDTAEASTDMVEIPHDLVQAGIFNPDPKAAIEQARDLVAHINNLIKPRYRDFVVNIQGREYPMVVWWTAIGQPLGLSPQTVWTKRIDEPQEHAAETWMARVEVVNRAGVTISSGEAVCARSEKAKGRWESYALLSMAQTRAIGRAYRTPLSFLAVLAGLQPVAVEEMDKRGEAIDEVDLTALPTDIKGVIKGLKWKAGHAKAELHQFMTHDGLVDADAVRSFLNPLLDAMVAEADERRS